MIHNTSKVVVLLLWEWQWFRQISDLEGYKRELEYHFKVNYKIKKDIFNNEDICEKCAGDEQFGEEAC